MSVFDDHIKSKTELEQFYDAVGDTIKSNFVPMYQYRLGNLYLISCEMNMFMNSVFKQKFDKFSIYHPWVHFELEDEYVSCQLFYSDDPVVYVHKDAKTFLKLKLDIPTI